MPVYRKFYTLSKLTGDFKFIAYNGEQGGEIVGQTHQMCRCSHFDLAQIGNAHTHRGGGSTHFQGISGLPPNQGSVSYFVSKSNWLDLAPLQLCFPHYLLCHQPHHSRSLGIILGMGTTVPRSNTTSCEAFLDTSTEYM